MGRKILLRGVGTFCRPGKPISEKYVFCTFSEGRGGDDDGGGGGGGGDDGGTLPANPPPLPNVPRDKISRKGNPSLRCVFFVVLAGKGAVECMAAKDP